MTNAAFAPLSVLGYGFFSSHHAGPGEAVRNERCEPQKPKFELLVARARRFTSLVTQIHIEICGQALQHLPEGTMPWTVFSSEHGEIQIAADLISDLLTHKSVSSARFAISVHNAPSGLLSIATHNRQGSTTIAAGSASFAAGLVEAFLIAEERRAPVLVSYADEPIPALFGGPLSDVALGFAMLLMPGSHPESIGTVQLSEGELTADNLLPFQGAALVAAAVREGRSLTVDLGSLRPEHAMKLSFSAIPAPNSSSP